MSSLLNRVAVLVGTTGTGTVTPGAAISGAHFTFAEAGAVNSTVYSYVLAEGTDVEMGIGTYLSAGPTFSRDTVTASKIGGTVGTSKMTLAGGAILTVTPLAVDISGLVHTTGDETIAGTKTFSTIPIGPASDPTTDNEFSRKAYVDAAGLARAGTSKVAVDTITADFTTTSLSAVETGLSFTIGASETWAFRLTCGLQDAVLSLAGPASPSSVAATTSYVEATPTVTVTSITSYTDLTMVGGIGEVVSQGVIVNGSTVGAVYVKVKRASSTARVKAGALLVAWRIA